MGDRAEDIQDETDTTTFADAWHSWLQYRCCGPRPLRLSTIADYKSIYRCHLAPHLESIPLAAIDGPTIAHLVVKVSAGGIGPKRVSNILIPLRACLRWHHRMGSFERDPAPWFETSAPAADERRILTIEQVERLIDAMPPKHRAFIATAVYTGMRAGELRALTWDDIDLVTRTARVDKSCYRDRVQHSTKTGHDRTAPLPPHLSDTLRNWRENCPHSPGDLVFPGPAGKPFDLDTFRARVFKPALRRAGLPDDVRIHDLRHTSASLYLQSGATVREVMEIHGWRQMQTALRYLHTGDTLTAAAERLSATRAGAIEAHHQKRA